MTTGRNRLICRSVHYSFVLFPLLIMLQPKVPRINNHVKIDLKICSSLGTLLARNVTVFQSKYQEQQSDQVISFDWTKPRCVFGSLKSRFLKGEQVLLLSSLFSFCRGLPLQSTDAPSLLLCLPVLGPGHGQSLWCRLGWRASSLNLFLIWRKPTSLSEAPESVVLLSVALFQSFSDQEPLHQQSPVGYHPLFFFLESKREEPST